ncbi:KilA domain protein [Desulfofarcimen acetoxidans DSM 771]|uniref:KilA domain protein n=2 Tax=Desulfofarcimen acetoxidans TaxID=58138 RepID=C8VXI1_DESAS|nr:KilA domain protein [Desulfofarcimen acetoxidans DSM 771]
MSKNMSKNKKTSVISVQDISVTIASSDMNDYICITDMAKAKDGDARAADIIKNWIRNRSTLEFLGTWEKMYNSNFKVVEFDHFKMQAGLPTFVLSAKQWIEKTNAIGLYVQAGRYGGTYAHKDIAFEFGSAISPVFKLYLLKEYQRLKDLEYDQQKLEWDAKRFLSKTNYLIHTDAVKKYILPQSDYVKQTEWLAYADEADLLNVALFGCTAKQWRQANEELAKKNNIRDFASINELTVLSNLETHNAELIKEGKSKEERFKILLEIAGYQISILDEADKMKVLNKQNGN